MICSLKAMNIRTRAWTLGILLGTPALAGDPAEIKAPVPPARETLFAAAGKADITPDLRRESVWLAGYGLRGRRATSVHDPLYARAVVFSKGRKTVAIVALDSIGVLREDVLDLRRRLGWNGADRYLFVSSVHSHATPDTVGIWGPLPGVSGVDQRYGERWKQAVVDLVRRLAERKERGRVVAARLDVDPRGLCRDIRDPVILDPELGAARVMDNAGRTVATLLRWSCHPVTLTEANTRISADYPGPLCAKIEGALGGTCLFLPGAIGGHLIADSDRSGTVERQYAELKRIGEALAGLALKALARAEPVDGPLSFRSETVRLPVENSRYLLLLRSLAHSHQLLDARGRPLPGWKSYWLPLRHLLFFPLPDELRPWIETELSRLRIGRLDVLGIPGELFPELAIGGYDGRHRFGQPLVDPSNPNPPDLAKAPRGPHLREKMRSKFGMIVGLANDEIGYIIPAYDFQIAPTRTMLPEPLGTHYAETNSLGRSATPILLQAFDRLLSR